MKDNLAYFYKRISIILVFIILLVMICTASFADEAPIKLSLVDAIAAALDKNPKLHNAQTSLSNSLSRLKIAGLTTSLTLGTTSFLDRTYNDRSGSGKLFSNIEYESLLGTSLSLALSPLASGTDRGTASFELRQPLRKGRGLFSSKSDAISGAQSDATIQEKELFLTTQSTVMSVVNAYYNAILAGEKVKVQEEAVRIAKETADGARNRAEEGLVAGIEVSRAEIRVAQTENELNIRKQEAVAALDTLMIAIGSGIGEKPELTDPVPEPETIGRLPDLATAMETALDNRSELAVYDTSISELARKLAIAKDNMRPALDLVANYSSEADNNGLISRTMWDAGEFSGGFEYSLPLDRRALTEEKAIADKSLEITRKLRIYQMEQIAKEVRDALRDYQMAQTSLDIFGQNLAVAQENLEMAQVMVDEGLTDNQEMLDAQEALTQVQDALVSAKVDLYLAAVNLKMVMGEDLSVMGEK